VHGQRLIWWRALAGQRHKLSQMILALLYPIVPGLDRLETASFLRSDGSFQFLTGLPSFPDPQTLRRFLLHAPESFWEQMHRVNDRLPQDFIHLPDPPSRLVFDLEPRICELREDFALRKIPTAKFAANALLLEIVRLAYNLVPAFQRNCLEEAWQNLTLQKLRYKLFLPPGELTRPQNRPVLRLLESAPLQSMAEGILAEVDLTRPDENGEIRAGGRITRVAADENGEIFGRGNEF